MNFFLWIFWNPSREIFTVPFLNRPVTWYGLLFALSFFVGYYLLLALYQKHLSLQPFFYSTQEISWVHLREFLKDGEFKAGDLPDDVKYQVLEKLNQRLEKEVVEGDVKSKLLDYSKQHLSPSQYKCLCNRLLWEQRYPKVFVSLKKRAVSFCEKLSIYVILGSVLGARIGHILFYENLGPFLQEPLRILKTWEGGLASHGAFLGVILSLAIFYIRYRKVFLISFINIIDYLCIPAALGGAFIRVGNFINQEILGKASAVSWAVVFGDPASGGAVIARHPAQLYEAGFYLLTFICLFRIFFHRPLQYMSGKVAGIFLTIVFTFRFFIEFIKEEQSVHCLSKNSFLMGQYLSVPIICFGIFLIFYNTLSFPKKQ